MKLDEYHKMLRERAKRYREAQKKSGRKQRQFFLTEAEFAYLKEILKKIRDEGEAINVVFRRTAARVQKRG